MTIRREGRIEYYLCQELRRKRMIPIINRISLKSSDGPAPMIKHAGEEFTYVLQGKVVVYSEPYEPVTLGVGESIYFDSRMGHTYFAAPDVDEAYVLTMCSSAEPDLASDITSVYDGLLLRQDGGGDQLPTTQTLGSQLADKGAEVAAVDARPTRPRARRASL